MTKKLIKLLLLIIFLHSCKKFENSVSEASNPVQLDSNSIQKTNHESIGKESFTLNCGSGCAMTYNEMEKNILGGKVEIKYKLTQYIDEKVEDEYFETYLFDSNSDEELTGIYEKGKKINILDSDEYAVGENLIEIGSKLFKNGIKSSTQQIKLVEENHPYKLLNLPFDLKSFVQNLPDNPNTVYTASLVLKEYLKSIDYEGEDYSCYFLKNDINKKVLLVAISRGDSQYYLVINSDDKKINSFKEIGSIGDEEPAYFKIDKNGIIQAK